LVADGRQADELVKIEDLVGNVGQVQLPQVSTEFAPLHVQKSGDVHFFLWFPTFLRQPICIQSSIFCHVYGG
jgi:hypothetical protein